MAESKIIYVPGTRVRTLSTKVTSESTAVLTRLTMDLSDLGGEDVLEYALQALAVKWQGIVRRKGAIPTSDTWKVPKPGTRQGAVVDLESAVKAATPEKALALLKILSEKMGLDLGAMLDAGGTSEAVEEGNSEAEAGE